MKNEVSITTLNLLAYADLCDKLKNHGLDGLIPLVILTCTSNFVV